MATAGKVIKCKGPCFKPLFVLPFDIAPPIHEIYASVGVAFWFFVFFSSVLYFFSGNA